MRPDIIVGDCRDVLLSLPSESVNCIVTSPPYFGLRDYGVDGQIGLEQTPDEYVAQIVGVLREARRVLRSDGTLWLNLGDSYSNGGRATRAIDTKNGAREMAMRPNDGCKPKDLIGIPWRVAFALQADGWYLRSSIIWHKPNPMPESVRDRPTSAHENLFLLAKSERYYYDHAAVREPATMRPQRRLGARDYGDAGVPAHRRGTSYERADERVDSPDGKRGLRNVWTITPKPFKGAHFATFPPDLIEPCVKAGCPEGGTVLDPFGGAGTTGLVSSRLGRRSILIELNPEYAAIAADRIAKAVTA